MSARLPIASLAVALLTSIAMPARAGFTVYHDHASFLAALDPNPFLDTYNDLPGEFFNSPINRSGNGFSYTASAASGFVGVGSPTDRWLISNGALLPIVYGNFGGGPTAVGGFFFGTDRSGDFKPGQSITVSVTGSDGTVTETLTNTTTDTFFGAVGTGPISEFRVTAVQSGSPDLEWPTVNDFIVGQGASPNVVPVPPGLALGLLGAATTGLGLLRRRRA